MAVLARALAGQPTWRRVRLGALAALVHFGVGLWWVLAFSGPGYGLLVALEAAFLAVAAGAVPPAGGAVFGLPAPLVLAEAARSRWPLGGLPLAGFDLGEVNGPLAGAAVVSGPLGVTFLIGVGVGVAALARPGSRRVGVGALALMTAVTALAATAPAGDSTGLLVVAAVQGGGPRGVPAIRADADAVFARHLRASSRVETPVDLVVWPEDVVDVAGPVAATPAGTELAALAQRLRSTLVVGVVEDAPRRRFRNAAIAFSPTAPIVARYDKAHRVPFGEYIPTRGFVRHLADVSAVPRDAIPGRGAGLLSTPAGPLGVVLSYEVFFPARARAAVRAGGEVLLVPTNASSYRDSQVPAQELAAARLRARETGRWTIQAAPTGYTAVVTPRGRVAARSHLGGAAVLRHAVERRRGLTLYARTGDTPPARARLGRARLRLGDRATSTLRRAWPTPTRSGRTR
jgi:apolipoprotein N-acyltransferase